MGDISRMHTRDALVLVVCALSVLFSLQNRGMFTLNLQWIEVIDPKLFRNGVFADETEHLPPPLVSDIDGDGIIDIVVVTREPKIKILNTNDPFVLDHEGDDVNVYPPKYEASLLSSVHVRAGRQAVAIASGYLTTQQPLPQPQPNPASQPQLQQQQQQQQQQQKQQQQQQQQVIVVVLEEWTVLCFDHTLNLLWEAQLQDEVNEVTHNKMFREVAVVISPNIIHAGDVKGSVIVGGRLVASPHHLKQQDGMHEEYQSHFSYVGLEGLKGQVRWKHSSADFLDGEEDNRHRLNKAQINYKLSLDHLAHHSGEKSWRVFRKAMSELLPHRWQLREHTQMLAAHILPDSAVRNSAHPTDDNSKPDSPLMFPMHYASSAVSNSLAPVQDTKQTDHPNVIVTKTHSGIEVIHFYTGRTVCQMPLGPGSVHIDLNGDGIIDHVHGQLQVLDERMGWTQKGEVLHVVASSGMPPHSQLFASPLMATASESEDGGWFGGETFSFESPPMDVFTFNLSPLPNILPRFDSSSGVTQPHVVYLRSTGLVTCLRPDGTVAWNTMTPCGWDKLPKDTHQPPPQISLEVVRLDARGSHAVIATATNHIVVLSQDGELMSEVELAGVAVALPIAVDLNADGVMDIVIETSTGYYGYEMRLSGDSIISKFVAGLLVLGACTVAVAFFSHQTPGSEEKKSHVGRSKYAYED